MKEEERVREVNVVQRDRHKEEIPVITLLYENSIITHVCMYVHTRSCGIVSVSNCGLIPMASTI